MAALFRRLLGPAMDALTPAVRAVHDSDLDLILAGTADIEASRNPLARLLCWMMRLPAPGTQVPTTVRFSRQDETETWHRTFGRRSYASRLSARNGLLIERMGPATNVFRLAVIEGTLQLDLVGFRFLGLPWPRSLRPRCTACESEAEGAFTFDIPISLPGLGRLIHYSGQLAITGGAIA